MSFELNVEQGDQLTVHCRGDLDINSSPELKARVLDAYRKEDKDIVFDFSQLHYLDSTGLGALISIFKNAREKGHTITIRHAKANVKKLFVITELDRQFQLED